MKHARPVHALIGVRAEIIPLGLQQVRRQSAAAIAVVIGQRGGKGRRGDAEMDRRGNDVPPVGLGVSYRFLEIGGQEQVFQFRIGGEGILDAFQEDRADDAAAAPQSAIEPKSSGHWCSAAAAAICTKPCA